MQHYGRDYRLNVLFQFEITINVLASSFTSFEFLCYKPTAINLVLFFFSAGIDF